MNILLLTDGVYPYVLGGMQKHSYYLAKYLAQKEVKVTLAHCVFNDNPCNYSEDYSTQELEYLEFLCFDFPKISNLPGHYIKENYQYSTDIYNTIKDRLGTYDFIYAQGFTGWKFMEEKKKNSALPPIFINFHGAEMFQKAPNFKLKLQHYLLRGPAKWNLLHADYVLSFGGHFVELYSKIGVEKKKTFEMPIGIESNWLNKEKSQLNQKRKFVFIGRYERRKGIEELNDALKLIDPSTYSIEFIGPIPEEKKIGLPSCIYHGAIYDQEKIKEILRESDVLICPSHAEGMPTVIMEAMASGLAIIATDVGAVSKQIDGNGWLIANSNVQLIKNAMVEAIEIDESGLTKMKLRSVELIEKKYLWNKVIDQFIDFSKSIVK